ncbi:hypothetical protein KY290_027068 [Solanum tuberosum]|uniref:Uncharacterized protein n=1 Tax=Solanum tuberosum TaxID=4113 RepID=A0ABQ7UDV2_SOLTU|nr:hypothetical protein KY284_026031 [Solanum tuberosum]KAH0747836.1 hypothetical protein KY290_027068 [Solanum tuberosum]
MVVLDRFSGGNDPQDWILRAEQYFTCLGFSQKDWQPLPYFYLDEKLLMRFPQRTASVSLVDTSRFCIDYVHYAKFVPPATSTSPVVTLSHITSSSDLEDVVTSGNMEADHMLEILPEKYTNVNSLALPIGSMVEIATLKGMGTLQIGNEISIEADLVQQTSSIDASQVFGECSPRDMSKRYVTATSPVRGSSKQKIECEIFEEMHRVELFLEPKTIEDLCLDNFFLEIGDSIPPSSMPSDDMMLVVEHENYTEELNAHNILSQFPFNPGATSPNIVVQETVVNFCVWDPGISFKFKSLTCSTVNVKPLLLLRSTIMFCSIAYANSVILVWDPGWQCRVHFLIFLCEFTWGTSLANRKR